MICQLPRYFFACLTALAAMLCLASCSKEQPIAENYDSMAIRMLDNACRAIQLNDTAKAMALLKAMTEQYPDDRFVSAAFRNEQKRQIITHANNLINTTNLNGLTTVIRKAETTGVTSPEILEFARVKEALDALRLFVSKMPWTHTETLQQNLRVLDLHAATLGKSPVYTAFRRQQDDTLAWLRHNDCMAATQKLVDAMDAAVISGAGLPLARALETSTVKTYPASPWTQCPAKLTAKAIRDIWPEAIKSPYLQQAIEIKALAQWKALDTAARQALLKALAENQPLSLCGLWLAAKNRLSTDAAAKFLRNLNTAGRKVTPRQSILTELLERQFLSPKHYFAWCWSSPCPGVPELVARIRQAGQGNKK